MKVPWRDTLLLACAAIIVVVLATTIVSRWWSVMFRGTTPSRSTRIDIERGAINVSLASDGTSQFTPEAGTWTLVRRNPDIASPEFRGFIVLPSLYRNPFVFQVVIPFWLMTVPVLCIATWRMHRVRKRLSDRSPNRAGVHEKPQAASS